MTVNYRGSPWDPSRGRTVPIPPGGGPPGARTTGVGPAPTSKDVEQENSQVTLYLMERILLAEGFCIPTVLAMYDTGANVNIIVTSLAERLGLKGRSIQQTITTAGGERTVHATKQYWVPLRKRSGEAYKVLCIGMDRITEDVGLVDVKEAAGLFGLREMDVYRPQGQVDLILGIHEAGIFPVYKARRGNLQLLGSCFGSGLVLAGSHPCLKPSGRGNGLGPMHFRKKGCGTMTARTKAKATPKTVKVNLAHSEGGCLATKAEFSFFESEELGLSQPARCGTCKNCSKCSIRSRQMSRKEQAELALVESSMVFDKEEGKVTFEYPYIKDVSGLCDNMGQAIKIEEAVEKRLVKMGKRKEYDRELLGYIGKGTFKELSKEEIEAWRIKGGPVNYISHHGVLKESSQTTKLRIVSNSSLVNNKAGFSLNDCLPKGPNSLVPLLEALITWRIYPHVAVWDYVKCYNSVHTAEKDMHLRRFVWRLDGDSVWRIYAIDRMHFGDRCAAVGLDVAKKLVAEAGRHIDSKAVDMVLRDYVDDGFGGGTEEDVKRIMGEVIVKSQDPTEEDEIQFHGTVPKIMKAGGFVIKYMIRDGETRPAVLKNHGGQVLGLKWNTEEDEIVMHPGINLSPKVNGVRTGPDLTPDTVSELDTAVMTLRVVTSQVYAIYDPLGLIAPLVIKFKLLLQELHRRKLPWDESLPKDLDSMARKQLKEIVLSGDIVFKRSLLGEVPEGSLERIQLIGFGDGADPASCACVYLRSELDRPGPEGQTHKSRLVMGKARVTPISKTEGDFKKSTPRSEMRGGQMLTRMISAMLPGMVYPPKEIHLFMDSECIISTVEADDKLLGVWMTNRADEWQGHMQDWRKQGIEVPDIYHWPGASNPADLGTRGLAVLWQVAAGSAWQDGPPVLGFARDKWPATREFRRQLPKEELLVKTVVLAAAPKLDGTAVRDDVKLAGQPLGSFPGENRPNPAGRRTPRGKDLLGKIKNKELADWIRTERRVRLVMNGTNCLRRAERVLARVLQSGKTMVKEDVEKEPGVQSLKEARLTMEVVSAVEITPRIQSLGRTLAPELSKGRWVTRGRMRRGLRPILGVKELLILLPDQRLAELVMRSS